MEKDRLKTESSISLKEKADIFQTFLEAQNGKNLERLDVSAPGSITDCLIIVSSTSKRHAQGLADGIMSICKEKGFEFLGMEGYALADWILLDCNDVLINIFQEEPRNLYKLEELWTRAQRNRNEEKTE